MTYLGFHILFSLPALLVAFWFARKRLSVGHLKIIFGVVIIVLLVATPWANWAVKSGTWDFTWDRVTPVVFYAFNKEWVLPAESYALFAVMALVVPLIATAFLPGDAFREALAKKKERREERYHY